MPLLALQAGRRTARRRHALRKAHLELLLLGVLPDDAVLHAPLRLLHEHVADRLGAACERDLPRVHVGRHHREQVVGTDQSLQHVHERLARAHGSREVGVPRVEKDHVHATPRVGSLPAAIVGAHRVAPFLACGRRRERHAFELRHLLRLVVFEHLEVVGREVGDRLALRVGRIDVHAHEVGFHAERWLCRRGGCAPSAGAGAGAEARARAGLAGPAQPAIALRAHRRTRGREQHQGRGREAEQGT